MASDSKGVVGRRTSSYAECQSSPRSGLHPNSRGLSLFGWSMSDRVGVFVGYQGRMRTEPAAGGAPRQDCAGRYTRCQSSPRSGFVPHSRGCFVGLAAVVSASKVGNRHQGVGRPWSCPSDQAVPTITSTVMNPVTATSGRSTTERSPGRRRSRLPDQAVRDRRRDPRTSAWYMVAQPDSETVLRERVRTPQDIELKG